MSESIQIRTRATSWAMPCSTSILPTVRPAECRNSSGLGFPSCRGCRLLPLRGMPDELLPFDGPCFGWADELTRDPSRPIPTELVPVDLAPLVDGHKKLPSISHSSVYVFSNIREPCPAGISSTRETIERFFLGTLRSRTSDERTSNTTISRTRIDQFD